jgi:D-sedoheptulose 7-phosphate isomerase
MQEFFSNRLKDSLDAISGLDSHLGFLQRIAEHLAECFRNEGTLYLCGNGGSAADAQHIAAEFVGRFLKERQALPAIALTCNTSILTAVGNDYDFSQIFARQVRASVRPSDCVVGISTSGQSANVIAALQAARDIGATTIGFTGESAADFATHCDLCFHAPSTETPRIQECHLVAWHLVCEAVEAKSSHAENEASNL